MSRNDSPATAALKQLTVIQRLTLDALRAGSRRELDFLILNRTAELAPYDRAYLWDMRKGVSLLGVSGQADVDPKREPCRSLRERVAREFPPLEFRHAANDDGRALLWLPLPVGGQPFAGLLLERLGPPDWTEGETGALRTLAEGYSGGLKPYAGTGILRTPDGGGIKLAAVAIVLALLAALFLVRLPLRIVAPCEVVAASPLPVNAPLDGVIRRIMVRPGQLVEKGEALYSYDDTVAREELAVSSREVEIARSNLERASAKAGIDREARSEARILQNRLSQSVVRLDAVRDRFAKLSVSAPEAGVVIMGEPSELVGKPVRTGEAVVVLADAGDNSLRIWLPQEDRIEFDAEKPLRVFLHADSGSSRRASLRYVAAHASHGLDGIYGFMAEADWTDGPGDARLGQRGTAVLYGGEVTLAYWLVRKPLAAVRRFLGV